MESRVGTARLWFLASPVNGSAVGWNRWYWLRVLNQNDDHGNAPIDATPVTGDGAVRSGVLEHTADVDYFRLDTGAAHLMSFDFCPNDSSDTIRLTAYDNNFNYLAHLDRSSCLGLDGLWPPTRILYFSIERVSGKTSGLAYTLTFDDEDDIDIDSTYQNAYPVQDGAHIGTLVRSSFDSTADEDWYRFEAEESVFYAIETTRIVPSTDCGAALEVYPPSNTVYSDVGPDEILDGDESGQGLGFPIAKDAGGGVSTGGSRVLLIAPVEGTYYIRVKRTGSALCAYDLYFHDSDNRNFGPLPPPG